MELSQDLILTLKKEFENGKNLTQLGKEYGINRKQISVELKKIGLKIQRGYTQDTINKIIELYRSGKSILAIARELHINNNRIALKLQQLGLRQIAEPTNKSKKFIEDDTTKYIKNAYINGASISQLAAEFKRSTNYVSRILNYYGVCETNRLNRKYHFNQDIFKKIDTEEKAYWLGLLYADGYIGHIDDIPQYVELCLQDKDKNLVQAFADFFQATPPITVKFKKVTNGQNAWRVCVASKTMANDLTALGCTIKKSLTLCFPDFLIDDEQLLRHFMRGYFDGDGSIYIPKSKGQQPVFSIVGTQNFCDVYNKMLVKYAHVNETKLGLSRGLHYCTHGGKNQVYKIFKFLYKDATIYMDRKYKKFISLYDSIAV